MTLQINIEETIGLLEQLVSIPSPSGNTEKVVSFIEEYIEDLNITSTRNHKGGLMVTIEGQDSNQRRLLTAHVDTLGAMVKEIKKNGRLKLAMIGGYRWNSVEGEYCEIETNSGSLISGTILMHQASVHVYKDAGTAERNENNIEVRIDEVVKSDEDVKKLGISVGDFVSFAPRFQRTNTGFIKSRHLDDKASAAILLQLIKEIKLNNVQLPHTTHFLFSNNEEIGYGGNSNIPEQTVEYLAVDMGAIGDGQTTTEYCVSICAKDSSGPYNLQFRNKLVKIASEHSLDYEIDIYPYYGSDASAAIRSGYDIVHGLIGPGIAESHSHERTHELSLINTGSLLYHYVLSSID